MSEVVPSIGLIQQNVARPVDPEELECMGKKAANLYTTGIKLTDAVTEVIKEAQLSPEQIKRVCEFANTTAYLHEFEKGGEVRNVIFEGGPANPSDVIKNANDGSSPAVHQVDSSDYSPPSDNYKTAEKDFEILEQAFGAKAMNKVASTSQKFSPVEEMYDLKIMLEDTRDNLVSKLASSQVIYDDVKNDLCETVKQSILEGHSLGDVATAWSSYSPNVFLFKEAMKTVRESLNDNKVLVKEAQDSSFQVRSNGSIPNPQHPLITQFVAFTKIANEHRKLEKAVEIIEEQIKNVNPSIRRMI